MHSPLHSPRHALGTQTNTLLQSKDNTLYCQLSHVILPSIVAKISMLRLSTWNAFLKIVVFGKLSKLIFSFIQCEFYTELIVTKIYSTINAYCLQKQNLIEIHSVHQAGRNFTVVSSLVSRSLQWLYTGPAVA